MIKGTQTSNRTSLINVFFIDLAQYRNERYYESIEYWERLGIEANFIEISTKWKLLKAILALLLKRPDFLVVNMWLLKPRVLMLIARISKTKVIYWQHGIEGYETFYTSPILLNRHIKIENALVLSKAAENSIKAIGISAKSFSKLPYQHFNKTINYSSNKRVLFYISQLIFPADSDELFSLHPTFKEGLKTMEECLREIVKFVNNNANEYELLIKKHPGDDTNFIDGFAASNIKIVDYFSWADCYMGHYSTMLIAAIENNKTLILPDRGVVDVFDFMPFVSNRAAKNIIKLHSIDEIESELLKVVKSEKNESLKHIDLKELLGDKFREIGKC